MFEGEMTVTCPRFVNFLLLLAHEQQYSVSDLKSRLCNEPFDYWQDGAPASRPTIVSRLLDAAYWQRQCILWFPTENGYTFGSNTSPDNNVHKVNKYTEGWRLENTTRLIWTNGQFDPWRTSGVSSEFRPGGPLPSTTQHPLQIIPGGFHCSDLVLKNAHFNAGVQTVVDNEVAQVGSSSPRNHQRHLADTDLSRS